MAKLGVFNATLDGVMAASDGSQKLILSICPESQYAIRQIQGDIQRDEIEKLKVSVEKYRDRRSLRQNRMMWSLLEIMARHLNGGRTGGVDAWDCYLDMLERFGGRFEYLECTKEALPALREMFRGIRIIEERKGGKTVMCKAYVGSSKFDTKEMSDLIDGILDVLAELGVSDGELEYWRQESYG